VGKGCWLVSRTGALRRIEACVCCLGVLDALGARAGGVVGVCVTKQTRHHIGTLVRSAGALSDYGPCSLGRYARLDSLVPPRAPLARAFVSLGKKL